MWKFGKYAANWPWTSAIPCARFSAGTSGKKYGIHPSGFICFHRKSCRDFQCNMPP